MQAHHYGLTVSNLDQALEFYRDKLGLDEIHRTGVDSERFSKVVGVSDASAEIVFLNGNGLVVELFEYDPEGERIHDDKQKNNNIGAHHIAFDVEDLDDWYKQLSEDVEFVNPPQEGGTGAYAAYLFDPDGNVVEIVEGDSIDYL